MPVSHALVHVKYFSIKFIRQFSLNFHALSDTQDQSFIYLHMFFHQIPRVNLYIFYILIYIRNPWPVSIPLQKSLDIQGWYIDVVYFNRYLRLFSIHLNNSQCSWGQFLYTCILYKILRPETSLYLPFVIKAFFMAKKCETNSHNEQFQRLDLE